MIDLNKKPRLLMCADFVRVGASLADIGTDHAYLPIYLLKNENIKNAVAADINFGPLQTAKENVLKNSLEEKITLCLSDGLDKIPQGEITDIVIAGMGGELIYSIIERCSWLRDEKINLILQPMTKCEVLIDGLYQIGFEINEQKTVREGDKIYTAMLVKYCGIEREMSKLFCHVGKLEPKKNVTDAEYCDRLIKRLKKSALGDSSLLSIAAELEKIIKTI